jgi:TonB-linked SusC/RagA family outer membrane protein
MKKGLPFSLAIAIMKISIIPTLLFLSSFCTFAKNSKAQEVYNKQISIHVKDQNLKSTLSRIAELSGAKFSYSSQLIQSVRKVTLSEKNEKLSAVLDKLLGQLGIQYLYYNEYIVLSKKTDNPTGSAIQAKTITGKVFDEKGQTLPGVSIGIKGTASGAVTDNNGDYRITVADDNAVLVFKYIGFITQEIPVSGKTTITVTLLPEAKNLDEVVVVAYGNITQRSSTGALQSVNYQELQDIPAAQFTQKLQGKLAGVQISQTTGRPGQGMRVTVRGSASISTGTSPLYVVDGFPVVGDISNINPDEIETITVLKDAASTALYGSRAAFGVVMVTTKTAKAGQTNVSVNAYTGVQQVPQKGRPDMMNGTEWAQFKKEYYQDLGQSVPAAFQDPAQYGEGYNWYNAMLRTAPISNYSVSINSNKDKFSTAVTAGFFQQNGVLLNSYYKRFSLRANSLFKVNDKVRVGVNIAPTYSFDNTPSSDGQFFGSGGLLYNAMLTPPVVPYQNADGSYPIAVTTPGVTAFPTPNWVRSIQDISSKNNVNRLLSNTYLEVEPIPKLILKSSINVDMGQSKYDYFQPSTAGRAFAAAPSAINANLTLNNFKYYSWLSENTASYAKQLGGHSFDVLGGYTVQRYRSDFSGVSGSNFSDDRIQTINAALVKNNPTMDIQEWSLISYLARLNYNFKGKYLLSASIRRDGSSRFGTNNKWGNFPAVSAAWVASEESFFRDINALTFLKIRGSYGLVGNNNIGNYTQYATVASAVNSPFNNNTASGIAVTNLGNTELGWEKTQELDLGLDLGLFGNRIYLTYDYYNKVTSNLLYSLPVPRESGFSNFTGNVGKISFWGHEIGLNTNNLVGKFKWSTNFNITFTDNKVLALSGISDQLIVSTGSAETITKVGGHIGQFYGLIQDGVYKDQADYDSSPKATNSQVGTIKFRDLNGDGVIKYGDTDGDKTIIGNPFPKFIFGFTNSFSYRKFDLSVVAAGSYGNDIARMTDQGTANLDGVFNVLKEVQNRWRSPSNPGDGKYGKTIGSTGDERDQFHSRFIQDGSFLTIKNITLGYSWDVKKLSMIKGIRFYGSIQQAFVFTKYGGANPEVGTDSNGNGASSLAQGLDFSAYPVPRTFTFGLNVNLK